MTNALTIVMYHYVRDTAATPHARLHALGVADFAAQLDYLERHYHVIAPERLIEAASGGPPLPGNAALLTFDDGYIDHYRTVAPMLAARGISAAFFPAAAPLREGRALDVNKVHFVRTAIGDAALVTETCRLVERYRAAHGLDSVAAYRARWAQPGRRDSDEVRMVKNLLQKGLPAAARRRIIDDLFAAHVGEDEAAFAAALYASADQLREMVRAGHHVGNHGYSHEWLDTLSPLEATEDILGGAEFLADLGMPRAGWIMCYPHGGFNDAVIAAARNAGAAAGLVVGFALAHLDRDDPMALPRMDTNQLPPMVAMEAASNA